MHDDDDPERRRIHADILALRRRSAQEAAAVRVMVQDKKKQKREHGRDGGGRAGQGSHSGKSAAVAATAQAASPMTRSMEQTEGYWEMFADFFYDGSTQPETEQSPLDERGACSQETPEPDTPGSAPEQVIVRPRLPPRVQPVQHRQARAFTTFVELDEYTDFYPERVRHKLTHHRSIANAVDVLQDGNAQTKVDTALA